MKIYAVPGTSMQTVVDDKVNYTPAPNEVRMQYERPEGDVVAKADGTWVQNFQGQIDELDQQYEADKKELLGYYNEADAMEDSDLKSEIRTELQELNETYDMEREELLEQQQAAEAVEEEEPAEAPAE